MFKRNAGWIVKSETFNLNKGVDLSYLLLNYKRTRSQNISINLPEFILIASSIFKLAEKDLVILCREGSAKLSVRYF